MASSGPGSVDTVHHREPDWVTQAMFWQIYPLGFVGAPIRPERPQHLGEPEHPVAAQPVAHRLRRIEAWLDHVVSLGLNGLQLGPVFTSTTHGYDTEDYFTVDPRLGDEAYLLHLIEAAHAKGIRVLFDGVFNPDGVQ